MTGSGKAYKASGTTLKFYTIDGKKYSFDENGKMLYGWVSTSSGRVTDEEGWAAEDASMYYLGDWDDGAMKTGWQKLEVYDSKDQGQVEYWFYFGSDGKRFYNNTDEAYREKKINGKTYGFDERGIMVSQWNLSSDSNASDPTAWAYFGDPSNGAGISRGWFLATPPSEETTFTDQVTDAESFDEQGASDGDQNWYYSDGNGNLYAGEIRFIDGKYYGFAPSGKMLSGLVFMSVDEKGKIKEIYGDELDQDDLENILDSNFKGIYDDNSSIYYFGEAQDGAARLGNYSLKVGDKQYDFLAGKSGAGKAGRGLTGIHDNKYIYKYGIRIKAEKEDKYTLVAATGTTGAKDSSVVRYDTEDNRNNALTFPEPNKKDEDVKFVTGFFNDVYLVNSSGLVVKNKTAVKDGADWYFYVYNYRVKLYTDNHSLPEGLQEWKTLKNYDRPR